MCCGLGYKPSINKYYVMTICSPKLAYIVVKKRINARFFKHGQFRVEPPGGARGGAGAGASRGGGDMRAGPVNPPPGTIIDTVVTKNCW